MSSMNASQVALCKKLTEGKSLQIQQDESGLEKEAKVKIIQHDKYYYVVAAFEHPYEVEPGEVVTEFWRSERHETHQQALSDLYHIAVVTNHLA